MKRQTKALAVFSAIAIISGLAACAEDSTGNTAKTKNSALTATLVNGDFAPTGGGWTGDGFVLDRGCAANNPSATRPSLGGWTRASLTFGRIAATVRQQIVVPNPGLVTFEVTGNVRPDDPNAWFKIDFNDADERQTSERQSGSASIKPKTFRLSVTTKTPNETVQVVLSGSGKNSWKGCYGPVLTKASLIALDTAAPTTEPATTVPETTTTTVPETTTTVPETTTTTIPATTTTVPETTTTAAPPTTTTVPGPTCTLMIETSGLSSCKLIKEYTYSFWNANTPLSGRQTAGGGQGWWSITFYSSRPPATATHAMVSLKFTDGTSIAEVKVPLKQTSPFELVVPLLGS